MLKSRFCATSKGQLLILTISMFVAIGANRACTQDMPPDLLQQTCSTLCQIPDAPWRSIPWQTDLLKAQRLAVEQAKPIFIWAMDGHPLGCT